MPKPTFFNLPTAKRDRIVNLAIEEFSEHPYREASLSRIVARAGIAKGSIYQYFDDKLDLYRWLILDELAARKSAAMQAALTPEMGFYDRLRAMVKAGVAFANAHPRLAQMGAAFIAPTVDPELVELSEDVKRQGHQAMRGLLAQAQREGELRENIDLDLAAVIISNTLGRCLIDVMLLELGVDLPTYLARAGAAPLSETQIDAVVDGMLDLLRCGLSPGR